MIERSRDRIPAGAAGEFSSPGSTFCAGSYFGIRSIHPCRITCERSESARERRIVLYKSDQYIYMCY